MPDPILICGAGPAGLVAAIHLARLGLPFRVIEKKTEIDRRSKALSMNAATLELFMDLGVADEILESASINREIHIHWRGKTLWNVPLTGVRSRFPYFAMLPQYATECILRRRLSELGGDLEIGRELVALEQHSDSVSVTIRDRSGLEEKGRYAFVLGCDGARSSVRELCGIAFEGFDYEMYFAMCDAPIRWPGKEGRWHYFVDEHRFAILIPLTQDLHRLVVKDHSDRPYRSNWQRRDFQNLLAAMHLDLSLGEPVWTSTARFYNRMAACFRQHRAFLLGDAAHLFSPIGGQGMNTGVQDAYNLAWKLGFHSLLGNGGEPLLDSYETERRGFATAVRASTDDMTNIIARIDKDPSGSLRNFLPSSRGQHFVHEILPVKLSGTDVTYGSNFAPRCSPGLRRGDRVSFRAPDARGSSIDLHDPTGRRLRLTYVISEERNCSRALSRVRELAAEIGPLLEVQFLTSRRRNDPLARAFSGVDAETLRVSLGLTDDSLILVRPDRFVAFSGRGSRASDLENLRSTRGHLLLGTSASLYDSWNRQKIILGGR